MSINLVNHLGVGVAYQLGNRVHIDTVLNTVRDVGMPIGVRRNRIRQAQPLPKSFETRLDGVRLPALALAVRKNGATAPVCREDSSKRLQAGSRVSCLRFTGRPPRFVLMNGPSRT